MKKTVWLLWAALLTAGISAVAATWHVDPLFDYYRGRSPESVVSELKVNGVDEVWYFAVTPDACNPELIAALKDSGIRVVLTLFPCWVYLSETDMDRYLPENWREWQMEFTNPEVKKDKIFIGFVHPEYNRWYRSYVVDLVNKYGFDGVTLIEAMYPCYNGFSYSPALFGDVGPEVGRAFGESLPKFVNPADGGYYLNDRAKMARFLAFRSKTICDFYKFIMDGVRAECPGVGVYTWSLGISESGGADKIRYFNGSDTFALVNAVRPDGHVVQTHWPDWCRSDLEPDYIKKYNEFAAAARRGCPGISVGFQGDCGSLPEMRRSPEWVAANLDAADGLFDFSVYYEFSIRYEVYSMAPELKSVERSGRNLTLAFDQRLGGDSAAAFKAANPWAEQAEVDGNLLKISVTSAAVVPAAADLSGICDDPASRLPLAGGKGDQRGRVNKLPRGSLQAVIAVE